MCLYVYVCVSYYTLVYISDEIKANQTMNEAVNSIHVCVCVCYVRMCVVYARLCMCHWGSMIVDALQ